MRKKHPLFPVETKTLKIQYEVCIKDPKLSFSSQAGDTG